MKPHTTPQSHNPMTSRGSNLPVRAAPVSISQFIVILDVQGTPIAVAPMEQLKHTSYPANQIRILHGLEEMAEIWS